MEDSLIFKIEITTKNGGLVQASNFLTKLMQDIPLNQDEVKGINSFHYRGSVETEKQLARIVCDYRDQFLAIRKPQFLQGVKEEYRLYFCFWIKEQSLVDVVDLQYDFLIKNFYEKEIIITVFTGDNDFYFRTSHYLYDVLMQYPLFYNRFFYFSNVDGRTKIQRLQKRNPGNLKFFMPFQFFNNTEQNLFAKKTGDIITEETLICEIQGSGKLSFAISPGLSGSIELMKNSIGKIFTDNLMPLCDLLCKGDILSFILFAYSFSYYYSDNKEVTLEMAKRFYYQIQEYSSGCQQLIENVIHHSSAKCGGLTVRLHKKGTDYVRLRYGDQFNGNPCLEVLVTDYVGINSLGNIADNFRNHIESGDQFSELRPVDFLIDLSEKDERQRKVLEAFQEYRSHDDNVGKHLGLKIFRNIVEENHAVFGFYSHRTHSSDVGENYQFMEYNSEHDSVNCMPGTAYTILFPLRDKKARIARTSVGIDNTEKIEQNIQLFQNNYNCVQLKINNFFGGFSSQKEKEKLIKELSDMMYTCRYDEKNKQNIVYINAEELLESFAEYIMKALILATIDRGAADYVFFNCSPAFYRSFQQAMYVFFQTQDLNYYYRNNKFVIALYTREPIECFFMIPGNQRDTIIANKRNCYAGNEYLAVMHILPDNKSENISEELGTHIPLYDVLLGVYPDGETIFEKYTLQILKTNIQDRKFGCKIMNTHMRLGSTIHIDCFYEAELLFGNRLFASRFSFLLVKYISESKGFCDSKKITLYSYALYSEILVVKTIHMLEKLFPEKEIDYAILEREEEHRGFTHVDRIRYSTVFASARERHEYFRDRKVICIVPINSTLKTHEKLFSLFCEDNPSFSIDNIILNFALVLVGSKESNSYWNINEAKRTIESRSLNIQPMPRYFIQVKVKYYEAIKCLLCFPQNPLDELPLVEVNASSTIPDQSFTLDQKPEEFVVDYRWLKKIENELLPLKSSLIYSHTKRGENHYLFYFKTDELFLNARQDIDDWLKDVSLKINVNEKDYYILFCPAHFSNAGFLECVNRTVFHDAAAVIRVDVDKEYRTNICTKYSNFTELVRLISEQHNSDINIKIYYIDDAIITGRTFYRSRSLISSIVRNYSSGGGNINVFEGIFVLIDRNSNANRLQYLNMPADRNSGNVLSDRYFAFRTLKISSMRNHGDSCTLCRLSREANFLVQMSSTRKMEDYWQHSAEKFEPQGVGGKHEENKVGKIEAENEEERSRRMDKSFRRMYCTHVANTILSSKYHGNNKVQILRNLLTLLIEDYRGRKAENQEKAAEYFYSYLKVISRPFLVFDKAVKEAIFDVLLLLAESLLRTGEIKITDVIKQTQKAYLLDVKNLLETLIQSIIYKDFSDDQRMDLMQLLIKQLTEMKSNFFIRTNNMERVSEFADHYLKHGKNNAVDKLYNRYMQQIKKLLGVSSDTSKSAWFNRELNSNTGKQKLPDWVLGGLILENTRAFRDGIDKLCKNKLIQKDEIRKFLCTSRWYGPEINSINGFLESGSLQYYDYLQKSIRIGEFDVPERERHTITESNAEAVFYQKKSEKQACYEKQKKNESKDLKILLDNELKKQQYRDFRSVLKDLELIKNDEIDEGGTVDIDEGGAVEIGACVQLMELCQNSYLMDKQDNFRQNKIEVICYQIACLMEKILCAKEVQILVESPLECDKWEDTVRGEYNELVRRHIPEKEQRERLLQIRNKKEYSVIAHSGRKRIEIEGATANIAEQLNQYSNDDDYAQNGYYIDLDRKFLIWQIGDMPERETDRRKLLVFAEFYKLDFPKDWYRLRNLFSMRWLLNQSVFNERVMEYLFELLLADKERMLYNLERAHSHTAAGVRHAQSGLTQRGQGTEAEYRSFVLILLSDLQVSQVYRNSLKEEYYNQSSDVYSRKCRDIFPFLGNNEKMEEIITLDRTDTSIRNIIQVNFPKECLVEQNEKELRADDEVISYAVGSASNEIFLLLYALFMNAAREKRGESNSGKNGERIFDVYVLKTPEGDLRIANRCQNIKKSADQINSELSLPPLKDNGISLWSVSRFVRGLLSTILRKKLKKTMEIIQGQDNNSVTDILERLGDLIKKYLSDEYRVKVSVKCGIDGSNYFCIDIPILSEKYAELE